MANRLSWVKEIWDSLWRLANRRLWGGRTPEPALNPEDMLRQEYAHVLGKPEWATSKEPLPKLIASLQGADERPQTDRRPSALCLSGGGIRSATFCLGVLQWLAGHGKLKDYHYLSTVSGGGYIGSFLVNGLRQAHLTASEEELNKGPVQPEQLERVIRDALQEWLKRLGNSAGTDHAAEAAGANRISGGVTDPIAPLRAYSNYLSPTGGLSTDAFALVAIFLRNLLLNLLVWLPVLAAAVALPRLYIALLTGPALPNSRGEWWPVWGVLTAVTLGIGYIVADLPPPKWRTPVPPQRAPSNHFSPACFLPITMSAFVLSLLGAWTQPLHKLDMWWFAGGGALAHVAGIVLGLLVRKYIRKLEMRPAGCVGIFGVIVVVIVGGVGGWLTSLVLSQLGQGTVTLHMSPMQQLLYASFSVPALTGAFWLAMALHAGLMGRASSEEDREWWARATAAWLKFTLIWVAVFAVVVWAPLFILEHAGEAGLTGVKFGVGGSALGAITALIGYWSKQGDKVKSKAQGAMRATGVKLLDVMAGAVLLAILLSLSLTWNVVLDRCHDWSWTETVCEVDVHAQTDLLREQAQLAAAAASVTSGDSVRTLPPELDPVSAGTAELGTTAGTQVYAHVLLNGSGRMLAVACGLLLILAALMAACIGANQFSLHGMYGNRLVRAYLGSGRPARHPHWFTRFDPDDNPKLSDLGAPLRGDDGQPRLLPVLNIALNLVKPSEKRLDWQQRKAASFFATPLHCGSYHLGFRRTKCYAGGVSLGRAMTISGAAASPNMGYHSSTLVTAVMTLFNVRLGWWLPNPKVNPDWHKDGPALGLDIMLAEAGGATGDEDNFVYLSDGGHFDNTGIYEMVRRRCRSIIMVDGTCDGEFKWGDLLDVVRKIRVDFGVPIELHGELPGAGRKPNLPRCLKGTIKYSARDPGVRDGELIVLKPLLLDSDPPELAAYARDSAKEGTPLDDPARFPHQSTVDQFYDEQQFESYRLLGHLTAEAALGDVAPPQPMKSRSVKAPPSLAALMAKSENASHAEDPSPTGAVSVIPGAGDLARASAGSMGQLVQQMGANVALATALTVGGTLGVVGSVAMKPGEVSLSAEDKALLKAGLQGKIEGKIEVPELKLDKASIDALSNGVSIQGADSLSRAAKQLDDAAKALNTALDKIPPGGRLTLDDKIGPLLIDLKNSIPPTVKISKDLEGAIEKLEHVVKGLPTSTQLTAAITDLKDTVKAVAPRQNIRGQEGAQR